MEDKVIKTSFSFVDTDTGEIISKGNYCETLSMFHEDSLSKYIQSFLRGVRLNKPVAIELVLSVVSYKPVELDFFKHVH